jgi:hypothetical protein
MAIVSGETIRSLIVYYTDMNVCFYDEQRKIVGGGLEVGDGRRFMHSAPC